MGLGTLALRSAAITFLAQREIPDRVQRALRLVAPAMLAGLVVQSLLFVDGSVRAFDSWHLAALGAAIVAWFTRSVAYTLGVGMVLLWTLGLIL